MAMRPKDVWVWGWGLTWNCGRRTEDKRQNKKATDGRGEKSARDREKGHWIGETDKEKSQKVLVYFQVAVEPAPLP